MISKNDTLIEALKNALINASKNTLRMLWLTLSIIIWLNLLGLLERFFQQQSFQCSFKWFSKQINDSLNKQSIYLLLTGWIRIMETMIWWRVAQQIMQKLELIFFNKSWPILTNHNTIFMSHDLLSTNHNAVFMSHDLLSTNHDLIMKYSFTK